MRNRLTIRNAAFLALLALLLLHSPGARAASDQAPDWLRAAAQQKLPDYDKETKAVILLDETQTTVQSLYTEVRRLQSLLDMIYASRTWKLHTIVEKVKGR